MFSLVIGVDEWIASNRIRLPFACTHREPEKSKQEPDETSSSGCDRSKQ